MTLAWREATLVDSLLARWDTRWKLAAFVLFGLIVLLLERWTSLTVTAGLVVGLAMLARVPTTVLLGRVGLLLLVSVPLLVVVPLQEMRNWPLAVAAALRIVSVGLLALILLRTDPLAQIMAAAHRLYFPKLLVLLIQLAYRYSQVIAGEVRRLRIALRSRGFRLKTNWLTYRTMSYAIGSVLVRSHDRAERVSEAMRCRGFSGDYHSLTPFRTRVSDVFAFVLLILAALTILILDRFPTIGMLNG